jgi:hypothetical protein
VHDIQRKLWGGPTGLMAYFLESSASNSWGRRIAWLPLFLNRSHHMHPLPSISIGEQNYLAIKLNFPLSSNGSMSLIY